LIENIGRIYELRVYLQVQRIICLFLLVEYVKALKTIETVADSEDYYVTPRELNGLGRILNPSSTNLPHKTVKKGLFYIFCNYSGHFFLP